MYGPRVLGPLRKLLLIFLVSSEFRENFYICVMSHSCLLGVSWKTQKEPRMEEATSGLPGVEGLGQERIETQNMEAWIPSSTSTLIKAFLLNPTKLGLD